MNYARFVPISARFSYSCRFCQKNIESECVIMMNDIVPLCSNNCKFRWIYNILMEYDKESLTKLYKSFVSNENVPDKEHLLAFSCAKTYSKLVIKDIQPKIKQDNTTHNTPILTHVSKPKDNTTHTHSYRSVLCVIVCYCVTGVILI